MNGVFSVFFNTRIGNLCLQVFVTCSWLIVFCSFVAPCNFLLPCPLIQHFVFGLFDDGDCGCLVFVVATAIATAVPGVAVAVAVAATAATALVAVVVIVIIALLSYGFSMLLVRVMRFSGHLLSISVCVA